MLYGSKVRFLIDSMVYEPLGKFEPSMFWRQGFRSLDFLWAFEKVYSPKVGLIMNNK